MNKDPEIPIKPLSRTRSIDVRVARTETIQMSCQEGNEKLLKAIRFFALPESFGRCSYCEQDVLWVELFSMKKAPLDVEETEGQLNIAFHNCPNRPTNPASSS
jgi:hypothetical protein